MADTNTTNLNLVKPEVGASTDSWGTKWNSNADAVDALFDAGPVLKVAKGGTGAATAAGARTNLGLGGLAVLNAVGASEITDGSVGTAEIAAGAVTTAKIADAQVTTAKIASASVTTALIGDGQVTTAKLAPAAVTTAEIADNAVTGAKIALGSDAQGDVMYYDGTNWVRLAAGTAGQVLKTNGAGANPAWSSIQTFLTAQAVSGQTAALFSSIPSGVRIIEVQFADVSLASGLRILVRIGTSGGVVTTGYKSTSQAVFNDSGGGGNIGADYATSGFTILPWDTTYSVSGAMRLRNISGNVWVSEHTLGCYSGSTPILVSGGGVLDLGGVLDRVQIGPSSSTFDAGTINIMYA